MADNQSLAEKARANIAPKLAQAKQYGQALGKYGTEKTKQAEKKMLGWLVGDYTVSEDKKCICGSDIEQRLQSKVSMFKWIIAVLVVLLVLFFFFGRMSKFSEPLFDFGIKQRRHVQLDGLGSNDTYSQRMGYDKVFNPEYSS
jgi:hypothetical protein